MSLDKSRNEPHDSIFAEAGEWLVDFREGDMDVEARTRFNAWLRRSPEHIQAYMEVAALWADIPKLAGDMTVDVDAVLAYARAQGNVAVLNVAGAGTQAQSAPSSLHNPSMAAAMRRPWALAAMLAAAFIVAGLIAWLQLGQGSLYATAIGEQRSIALADGSTIDLGARSSLRVRLSRSERHIELLAGQALFNVAKDSVRPFIVISDNTRVRAVGTQFDVHKRSSGTTVTVLEGRVAILPEISSPADRDSAPGAAEGNSNSGTSVPKDTETSSSPGSRSEHPVDDTPADPHALYVSAGEQVTVPASDTPLARHSAGAAGVQVPRLRTVDAVVATAWTDRTLTFENAPLADVIEEFNRYNQKQMVLAAPVSDVVRISGVFSATKPGSLLRFLSEQTQLAVTTTDRQINISPKDTKNFTQR